MKKYGLVLVFFIFICLSAFAYLEEIDYLLFKPNSSNEFADEALAKEHLDDLAYYLTNRNLGFGEIHVFGYSIEAANDIESDVLARERALFVINELLNRGVPEYLFADPVTYNIDNRTFAYDTIPAAINQENSTHANIFWMLLLVLFTVLSIGVIVFFSSVHIEPLATLKLYSPALNQRNTLKQTSSMDTAS